MEIIPLTKTQWEKIDKATKRFVETVLNIRPQASTQWVLNEANIMPAEAMWKHVTVSKWCKRKCGVSIDIPHLQSSRWDLAARNMAKSLKITVPPAPSKYLVKKAVTINSTQLQNEIFREWVKERKHFQLSPWILTSAGVMNKTNAISTSPFATTIMNARAHTIGMSSDRYGAVTAKHMRRAKCPGTCNAMDTLSHAVFECDHPPTEASRERWWATLKIRASAETYEWISNQQITAERKTAFILGFIPEEWEILAETLAEVINEICRNRGLHVYAESRYNK
jgi:hypothetical protein